MERRKNKTVRIRGGLAACLLALLFWPSLVEAQDTWLYRRSYYSHALPPGAESPLPQPVSRSAYRPAYYADAPGIWVRGAYRNQRITIRSGNSVDWTVIHDHWIEFRPR